MWQEASVGKITNVEGSGVIASTPLNAGNAGENTAKSPSTLNFTATENGTIAQEISI